jgi:hypothetical protein
MPRSAPSLTSFVAGEISPRLEGRVDLDKYRSGAAELLNMVVHPHGGASRRPGTEYIGEIKSSSVKGRLIPFEFKTSDTYILEFGDQTMRVVRNGEYVLDAAKNITAITKANPGVITSAGHGLSNGDEIFISSVGGMTELNTRNYRLANVTTDTFTLTDLFGAAIDTTNFTAYTSGGTAEEIFNIATPYPEAVLADLRFVQSADTMFIVHPSHEPRKLTRTDHTAWTFSTITFIDGPYLDVNTTTTTLNPNADTGTGVALVASTNLFAATDVGRLVSLPGGNATITAFTDAQNVTVTINDTLSATTATTNWALGAFSNTTGFPSVVTFFEQRLIFGATTNEPQSLFMSKSGDFENFTAGTADDSAIIFQIASNRVNSIRYLAATRVLTIGTSGGEYVLSTTNDGPITPTNAQIRKYSNYGTANVEPVQVADVTLFLQRAKRKFREFKYAGEINASGYAAADMSILSEHITLGGITDVAYQQEPDSIVWLIRADGQLLGMTYRREEEVVAWHQHKIGGTYTGTHGSLASATYDYGMVESIAVLPTEVSEDELYMIVKRTIGGVTKRYLERMKPFDFGTDATTAFFVDSGLSYSGSSTTSLTGLYHLAGQTVSILNNGASHPDATVTAGGVTVSPATTKAAVGLNYTSRLKTLRLEAGSSDGTSQGKIKRIHEITLRLHKTLGVEVGSDVTDVDRIPFRDSSMAMGSAVSLFTGDKEIEFRGGFEEDDQIVIQQTQPLPLTVLAIYPRMNTFDS